MCRSTAVSTGLTCVDRQPLQLWTTPAGTPGFGNSSLVAVPFRGSDSGFSRQQLRARRFVRLSRDIYVLRGTEMELRERVMAARLARPDGVACLQTAALLLGLPVDDDGLVHLAGGAAAARSGRARLVVHRLSPRDDEVLTIRGISLTSGPRCFTDLAAHLGLEQLVALGDVVLRRYGPNSLDDAVARAKGRRGAALARQALPLLDPGADSPAETRARLRLHAAGFIGMRHGVIVRDQAGGWLARPDLADEGARVALQHEGLVHFRKGEKQRRKDVDRDELVRQQHWQVVVSTAIDDARPDRLIEKVTAAYLRSAVLHGRGVLPPHLRGHGGGLAGFAMRPADERRVTPLTAGGTGA